jgi:serine/threonine protein kinase
MTTDATIREAEDNSAATIREGNSQETMREFHDSSVSTPFEIRNFRNYSVTQQLPTSGSESDIYLVEKDSEQFILKLFRYKIEPKIEIHNKIVSLSADHKDELIRMYESGYDESTQRWYSIQEYAKHGSLKTLIGEFPKLSEDKKNEMFNSILREISNSLILLHENGILHLDLKPANVLARSLSPFDLVLIDFGISSNLDSELSKKFTAVRGTPMYQSPESWIGAVGEASDWWSLGMMALEIASGKHPFDGLSHQVIASILSTKTIEIPSHISPNKRLLLHGLLTRDMSKRWKYVQVSRWLNGERDIPVYFESAPELHKSATDENVRPLSFMGEKHTNLETFARAVASDETSWAKGREFLMRGNIRTWLEWNNESERAEEIYSLIEDVDDLNDKVFIFVHLCGRSLPFVYMGKDINFNNLHLCLWKIMWQKETTKAEAAIIERLCNGKLIQLLDYYLQHNETNDELVALKEITSNAKDKTPESIYNYLDIIANSNNYFLPFLNSQSSFSDAVKAISAIQKPITIERWNEISNEYVIPMKELRSVETYINAFERIEKLKEDKLLFKASDLPDNRREELENCDIESYTEQAYVELWGYDDKIISLLYNLLKKFEELHSGSEDKFEKMNFSVVIRYIENFKRKSVIILNEDKVLLGVMNEFPASFGSAAFALYEINEISPAGDKILQAKTEYMRNKAEESESDKAKKSMRNESMSSRTRDRRAALWIMLAVLFITRIIFINIYTFVTFIIIITLYACFTYYKNKKRRD